MVALNMRKEVANAAIASIRSKPASAKSLSIGRYSRTAVSGSIRGYRKIDGNIRPGFDGQRAHVVGFEMPLANCLLGGIGQNGWSAENAQVLDQSIAPN